MPTEETWFTYLKKIDFSKPPNARAFFGFLKQPPDYSNTNKVWRLYLTIDLDDYIEFNEDDDYLGSVPLETNENPPGTIVWIKSSSKIRRVNAVSKHAEADFLRGEITSKHQSRTGIEALATVSPMKPQPPTGMACTQVTYCQC